MTNLNMKHGYLEATKSSNQLEHRGSRNIDTNSYIKEYMDLIFKNAENMRHLSLRKSELPSP
jgi:hypothetical protein